MASVIYQVGVSVKTAWATTVACFFIIVVIGLFFFFFVCLFVCLFVCYTCRGLSIVLVVIIHILRERKKREEYITCWCFTVVATGDRLSRGLMNGGLRGYIVICIYDLCVGDA